MKLLLWMHIVRVVALWLCEKDVKKTLWATEDKERFHNVRVVALLLCEKDIKKRHYGLQWTRKDFTVVSDFLIKQL